MEPLRERADSEELEELTRLEAVINSAIARIDGVDADVVTQQMLEDLDEAVQRVINETNQQLELLKQDQSADFSGVVRTADVILDALGTWPPAGLPQEVSTALEAVRSLERQAPKLLERLEARADELGSRLDELVQHNSAAVEDFDQGTEEVRSTIDEQKGRLDAAIQQQEALFGEAQEQRRQEFQEFSDGAKAKADETIAQIQSEATESGESFSTKAREELDQMQSLRERAEEIVGVIARTGMAGGYQTYAEEEGKSANRWRWFTVISALGAILFLAWAAFTTQATGLEPERLLIKFAISLAFGGLAGYTARQSGHHRDAAVRARNIQLALASIGPYLQNVDPAKREAIFEAFSYLFFSPPTSAKAQEEPGPAQFQTFLELIRKTTEPSS